MPCYHPIQGWKGPDGQISFSRRSDLPMQVPCGQCVGCRLERSRQWAVRIMHEAQMHDENSFVTLTYDPEHLPEGARLVKKDFQDFMKRLRKFYAGERISFYHCGEYGEECYHCGQSRRNCRCGNWRTALGRPHYHAVLFGVWFPDSRLRKHNARGEALYESATLTRLWGKGDALIGVVTFESAGYVARYTVDKINGDRAEKHYEKVNRLTGEVYAVPCEYSTMSLRPGIGLRWYEKYGAEVEDSDSVVMRGREMRPPRYYDKLRDAGLLKEVKKDRRRELRKHAADLTRKRLQVREEVKLAQVSLLRRSVE